jgi:hypothetical protein
MKNLNESLEEQVMINNRSPFGLNDDLIMSSTSDEPESIMISNRLQIKIFILNLLLDSQYNHRLATKRFCSSQ